MTKTKTETKTKPGPEVEAEIEIETKAEAEAGAEEKIETEVEAGIDPEAKVKAGIEIGKEAKIETRIEPETRKKIEIRTETQILHAKVAKSKLTKHLPKKRVLVEIMVIQQNQKRFDLVLCLLPGHIQYSIFLHTGYTLITELQMQSSAASHSCLGCIYQPWNAVGT